MIFSALWGSKHPRLSFSCSTFSPDSCDTPKRQITAHTYAHTCMQCHIWYLNLCSHHAPGTWYQAWSQDDPGSAGTRMQKDEEVLCMHVLAFAYITADLLLNIRYLHRGVKVTVATPHALICKILVKSAPCSRKCPFQQVILTSLQIASKNPNYIDKTTFCEKTKETQSCYSHVYSGNTERMSRYISIRSCLIPPYHLPAVQPLALFGLSATAYMH